MNPLLLAASLSLPVPAPVPTVREEVVVTAERGPESRADVPAAVSVLTRDEISHLPAETLSELLRFLPGFHAFFASPGAGTAPMVTARGFFGGGEAEYVQLRVDGVPVGDPESGLVDWRRIRAADVARIEALRGPASSLYGDTALAGVIEVFTTERAGEAGVDARAEASGGSFGSFSLGGWGQAGRFGGTAGAGGSYSRTDGERSHSAVDTAGVEAGVSGAAAGGAWSLTASGTSLHREDPGALDRETSRTEPDASDPMFRFDREATRRGRLAASWSREDSPLPWRLRVFGQLRQTELVRTLPLAPGIGDRALRELDTSGAGIAAEGERSFALFGRSARLRFGAEAARDALDGVYRPVDEEGRAGSVVAASAGTRVRAAAFVLQDWRPTERVRVTAGLRWDRVADRFRGDTSGSATHGAWSPRVGISVRLGRAGATSVFAQYSHAFKTPTLDQLFDPRPFPDSAGGSFTVSNPDLSPQRARTLEAGASGAAWDALDLEASVYRIEVDDEIDFDPATFRYRNIGRSLHTGVEASARWRRSDPVRPFLSWAWSRVVARDGENAGLQLKNVPRHLLRAGLAADLPAAIRAEAIVSRMFGRFADDAHRFALEDALLLDVRLERNFGALTARIDFVNAADARSDEIGFVLADPSGGAVPYFYPGSRRAVRAGLTYRK